MKKVNFLFGIHCHQPVGNFEHIFTEAYERSYLPFIKVMARHPRIKFAFHYSGILYDWFQAQRPEFLELLQNLVQRGQAEVMTAGYYEPIIPIIPDSDKLGQITLANDFIKSQFGQAPKGLWLTERIWEPQLPKILNRVGIDYVTVDDYHFISAGVAKEKLLGYYVTEEEGATLKVFPINKNLRYLIPFKLPEETINYLRQIAAETGQPAAIMADDGEKFGVWPGTHQWVYQEGYLERLMSLLEENSDWINFCSFSEYLDEQPALGRIYLPTASYFEMMEWALPTAAGKHLARIVEELKQRGKSEEYEQFFKGGFFRNFFVKYPEANNLHKRMLQVSQRLESLQKGKSLIGEREREKQLRQARLELYQGQCNCAYWHGVFGGLYLNYLRDALYTHLLRAEALIDQYARGKDNYTEITVTDFDKDGQDEVILTNNLLNLYFAPAQGGGLFELDYKPKNYNLLNTLARREEAYHEKLRNILNSPQSGGEAGTSSIHEQLQVKETGLENALIYDWHRRIALLDHFCEPTCELAAFSQERYQERGDFVVEPYDFMPQRRGGEVAVVLTRAGKVGSQPVKVEKTIALCPKQSIVNIHYQLTNNSSEELVTKFGLEFNFSCLAGRATDRYYEIPGAKLTDRALASTGVNERVATVKIVDKWKGIVVSLETDQPTTLWRFPIETVSQSESGLEKNYQGSVLFPNWLLSLAAGEKWSVKLVLKIED